MIGSVMPVKRRVAIGLARNLALLLTLVFAVAFVPSAAAYNTTKYVANETFVANEYAYTAGYASREWNKFWRPAGYSFGLKYTGFSYIFDTWSNPFVDNRNAFNAQAYCLDNSSLVNSVTCMSTYP